MPRWSQECGGARASFGSLEKQHRCRCCSSWWCPFWDLGRRWFCFSHSMWRKAALPPASLPTHLLFSLAFKLDRGCSFRGGSDGKESACNTGDAALIPGPGRSLGEGNSYPLQYSCLENPMDREAQRATVHGVAKSWTRLSDFYFHART